MKKNSIIIKNLEKRIFSGHIKLGGSNPRGDTISFTNYYMELNGKPFFGICGEFHYSRCPYLNWEEEILKMKAAGINIISTYIFWNHHEEDEGEFTWAGDKNLRYFVDLCAKHDLYVMARIGPFVHGEARNGGFPDWLYGRPFAVRSNDEGYLYYVKRLYYEIGKQVKGQMYKDGGPVIGIQLENEHMHASPPWEFMVMKELEWVGTGRDGVEHIKVLKRLAVEAGMEVPVYTCTGWGGASFIEEETLPLYGGYAFQPWLFLYCNEEGSDRHKPSNEYLIQSFHDGNFKCAEFNPPYDPEKYPYACCELGGGMACWYVYRFSIPPENIEAATIARIAGGCNFIGYYMFHDGTNPAGKHNYLNERVVPKVSYNFQAPIGEYGQIRDSFRRLKPLFYFIKEYGEILCLMGTDIPDGMEKLIPEDVNTLRYAVRQKEGSGFVFLINYQDHVEMKDQESITLEINLPGETITLPRGKGFTLKKNASAILPFNLDMDGVRLKYSTTQLVTSIKENNTKTYFFFAPDGMESSYCFDASSYKTLEAKGGTVQKNGNYTVVSVNPGIESAIAITEKNGKRIVICTLTCKQALGMWKFDLWGRERVILSKADIIKRDDLLDVRSIGAPEISVSIFPPAGNELSTPFGRLKGKAGEIFETFEITLPKKDIRLDVQRVSADKAVVSIPADSLQGSDEVYLHIDYLGNVGNAFIDGTLISDNFCNGEIWEIGLKRFFLKALEKGVYFHIIPYKNGSDVVFDPDIRFRHEFSEERTAEIYSIDAVPEYRIQIGRAK